MTHTPKVDQDNFKEYIISEIGEGEADGYMLKRNISRTERGWWCLDINRLRSSVDSCMFTNILLITKLR